MTMANSSLLNNILTFEIDDPNSSFTFSDRLSRENGWSTEYSHRVILEYKKYIYLLCISGHPLTPSDQVDQAWHLHLLYTRSYWIEFCRNTLSKDIHHEPTKGGNSEGEKFNDWYTKTKELYKTEFNVEPPEDIWPSNKNRFNDTHFQRINIKKNWVIKKYLV